MAERHKLPKIALLHYALDGARTLLGMGVGMDDEEIDTIERDIREIERRIHLVELAAARDATKG